MLESVLVPDFNAFGIYLGVELLGYMGFPGGSVIKNVPAPEMWVQSLGEEDLLEEEMVIDSSIPA